MELRPISVFRNPTLPGFGNVNLYDRIKLCILRRCLLSFLSPVIITVSLVILGRENKNSCSNILNWRKKSCCVSYFILFFFLSSQNGQLNISSMEMWGILVNQVLSCNSVYWNWSCFFHVIYASFWLPAINNLASVIWHL